MQGPLSESDCSSNQISCKFHIWIASIKLPFKFQYGFCLMNNDLDFRQNGHRLCVRFRGHSNSVIFNLVSFKLNIWIASIKLVLKFQYGFCPTNNYRDGQQKWLPPIGLLLWTHYCCHLLPDCFHISYIDYFYQTLTQIRIWALSDNQDDRLNSPHLSVCTCGHSLLSHYHLIPSKSYTHYFNQTLVKLKYGFCQTNDNQPPHLLLDCYQISYFGLF